MYAIVAGAGKVGVNLTRELIGQGHEVTLIENDRLRYLGVEQLLEHNVLYGDSSEIWVLERAGIQRADMVIAVTGDDEDNILICQVARDKYGIERIIARVNNPSNRPHFDLLDIKPVVSATEVILRLLEHEVPHRRLIHLLELEEEAIEIIEIRLGTGSPVVGRTVAEVGTPANSLVIAIIRDGHGIVPNASTRFEEGDDILAVLDPDREEELKRIFSGE